MSRERLNAIIFDQAMRASLEARFWPKVDRRGDDECWDWIAKAKHPFGYGRMTAGRGFHLKAHQIAYALANGRIGREEIRHSCDRPQCCNPAHLVAGTHTDNMADAKTRGRASAPPRRFGEKHHKTKFSEQDALAICRDSRPARLVAPEYGVCQATIWRLRKGESWRELVR
jgi:hypothetical protein